MRTKKIAFLHILLMWFGMFSLAQAIPAVIPSPPSVQASAYVLMDFNSGKLLASQDPDKRIEPASLTKMMTMYVVDNEIKAGKIKLTDNVIISEKAWRTEGSKMFVEANKEVQVQDLIRGIIIQSGNDSSIALAEHIAGTEEAFATIMNQYAKELKMDSTHFTNATGLPDPEHYTTAHDLAKLSQALIRDFPESYKLYSEKWFTFGTIKQPNRNRLLWREPFVDGIKTGHSESAGYCLAASGMKDGMRLISVIVGTPSDSARTEQTQQLLRYGFRFFETHRLFAQNDVVNETRIWMGNAKTIKLGADSDFYITVPQGQYGNLKTTTEFDGRITAPIKQGDTIGKIVVKLNDELLAERSLIALQDVEKGGLWDRASDYFSLGLHKLFNSQES